MPKAKPNYTNPIGGWSTPAEFTCEQKERLIEICGDPEFLRSFSEIAGDYKANMELYGKIPSDAEELATLKDVKDSILDLKGKLSKLNWLAGDYLFKVDIDIDDAKKSLEKIYIETILAIEKFPKPNPGRKKDSAKWEASRSVKRLFDRHSIRWHANTWPDVADNVPYTKCPAIDVLYILFNGSITCQAIAEYVTALDE